MEHEGIDVTAPDRLTALSNVAALEILVTRSILRLFPDNLAGPLRVRREDRTGIEQKDAGRRGRLRAKLRPMKSFGKDMLNEGMGYGSTSS